MSHINEQTWTTDSGLRATCLLVSLHTRSHRCGYVEVPEGHPLHGVHYANDCEVLRNQVERVKDGPVGSRGVVPTVCWDGERASPEIIFDVHGSITFSGPLGDHPNGWWFGFDCSHAGDEGGRPLEYVVAECERLGVQLAAVGVGNPSSADETINPMTNSPTPENNVLLFREAAEAAGLKWKVHAGCWQILGGVNYPQVICSYDPMLLTGFCYTACPGGPGAQIGTVADAIRAAGPPKQEPVADPARRPWWLRLGQWLTAREW